LADAGIGIADIVEGLIIRDWKKNLDVQKQMEKTVKYGTTSIDFSVEWKQRKTMALEVHPNMTVHIIAPNKTTVEEIQKKVVKRGAWIIKQQTYFEQFLPRTPKREYASGETHLYLGKKYVLKIRESQKESVKLKGGELFVFIKKGSSNTRIKNLLSGWYRSHCERRFQESFDKCIYLFKPYKFEQPTFVIKRMKNRWGSCTPNGQIILNPELIKVSSKCLEYVIIHELCHLIEPSHSKKFYTLPESILPNWKRWKDKLEMSLI
jgi:predicted metal-dependent hydrolase